MNDNEEKIKNAINAVIHDLVEELGTIEDLPTYRDHRWFDVIEGYPGMKALMYYLLGDKKRASEDLDRITARFAEIPGREKLAKKTHWCQRYNMSL